MEKKGKMGYTKRGIEWRVLARHRDTVRHHASTGQSLGFFMLTSVLSSPEAIRSDPPYESALTRSGSGSLLLKKNWAWSSIQRAPSGSFYLKKGYLKTYQSKQ